MEQYKIKIINAKKATDFVGVRIDGYNVNVHVPEAFRYDSKNIKNSMPEIIQLLKSVRLATTIRKQDMKTSDSYEVGEVWSIDSYLWLINDYIDNGFYYQRNKVYIGNGNGKIDWKRTLKKTPFLSDGNIIYSNITTSKVAPSNSVITQVYKCCLDLSLKRIGWVFDYKFKIDFERTMSIKEMIYVIKGELSSTFDDIKCKRFKHMVSILENLSDDYSKSNKYTYGIEHYYYVFEKMIDLMFGNISDAQKKRYNPATFWVIGDDKTHRNNPLEPDTIHNFMDKEVKTTYIIDSKLYSYGCTASLNNLPGSQSIQKQITYGDYVKNTLEKGKDVLVRNIFILPYNKENNDFCVKDDLYCFGYSSAEWRNNEMLQDHDYIFGCFIDFNYLLLNYKNNRIRKPNSIYMNIENKLVKLRR